MPGESGALWYDDEAGPMVRPYTVTRGRTTGPGSAPQMDVIALVSLPSDDGEDFVDPPLPANEAAHPSAVEGRRRADRLAAALKGESEAGEPSKRPPARPGGGEPLGDDHLALLEHCRSGPLSVADLAAEADLPLGVVRVLLSDLVEFGHVRVTSPVPPADLPDIGLLQHLITGLRSL